MLFTQSLIRKSGDIDFSFFYILVYGNKEVYKSINRVSKLIGEKSTPITFNYGTFYVDNEMVDLIYHLNNVVGVQTDSCCYGHLKRVPYITIKGAYDIDCKCLKTVVVELNDSTAKVVGGNYLTRIEANYVGRGVSEWLNEFVLFRDRILSLTRDSFKVKDN